MLNNPFFIGVSRLLTAFSIKNINL
jgi:hypothetical protein